MRALVVLSVLLGVASADAPKGRYRLKVDGGAQSIYDAAGNRVPSCGRRAAELVANLGTLAIEVAGDVKVNGELWAPGPATADAIRVVNDQLLKGLSVQLSFSRERADAAGMVIVAGVSNGVMQCGDGRRLVGRYRR